MSRPRATSRLLQGTLLMAVFLLLLLLTPSVSAKNCAAKNSLSAWKHQGGMFRRMPNPDIKGGPYVWKEFDNNWAVQATFVESVRDVGQQQIVLVDNTRGVSLLLRGDLCGIKGKNDQQFQQLYGGSWVRVIDCS